ncbi:histone H3/H4 domain-containing protein [Bacteroides zoogleoformans]|uniref:hypothetical protein n=2 Tax=Bacteroides zoogleoformans TaxID=28119 RepID=UPI00101AE7E1|nr:hypothetical protein [Bacteroides zoogleoformans]
MYYTIKCKPPVNHVFSATSSRVIISFIFGHKDTGRRDCRKYVVYRRLTNDFLRIEFTLDDQNAFDHHKMKHIQNLGDLLDNYSDLYRFFVREIKRLVLFNKLSYQEEKLTPKERHIIYGLENFGFEMFLEEYRAERIESAKTSDSKKSAKSDAFKDVVIILKKYASEEDYNFKTPVGGIKSVRT